MRKEPERARIATALAALFLTAALFQPGATRAHDGGGGGHGGGGFHGSGFHCGPGGSCRWVSWRAWRISRGICWISPWRVSRRWVHARGFRGERFHHHGFHGGGVLAPVFGGLW